MPDYLLQEDGFKISLEDSSGFIILEDTVFGRITQTPVEVVVAGDPDGRITQAPVEVVMKGDPDGRFTQTPIEVIMQNTIETVNLFLIDLELEEEP